ncbi:hypothetical protein [Streptomyces sp. NPDC019507]|uniref:hypothetical protein n=1 Tax=Streptomyces sp. NPDC019507 TaxID=3154689 RepID=UPI0033C2753F
MRTWSGNGAVPTREAAFDRTSGPHTPCRRTPAHRHTAEHEGSRALTDPDPAERMARRQAAYHPTAAEGLPHHVREAAAAALEAIDDGRDRDTQSAVENLTKAVQEQRRGR